MPRPLLLAIGIPISKKCRSGCALISASSIWSVSAIKGAGMATIVASVGSPLATGDQNKAAQAEILESIQHLFSWLETNDYRGYDTFDGLSAWVRPLTFKTKFLQTVLQQGVRRFPLNLRPVLGIPRAQSTKGMAFLA